MSFVHTEDQALVQGILAGSEESLRQFSQAYTKRLFAFIQNKIANEADAEEILQDVLLAGLEGLRDFDYRSKLSTYLFAIANHKVIDHYRKRKIKQVVFSQMPEEFLPIVSAIVGPEEEFDIKEVRERMAHALSKLSPQYQKVLVMKYMEDLPVAQIALKLSISFKSAESTLFRARSAFVKLYVQT